MNREDQLELGQVRIATPTPGIVRRLGAWACLLLTAAALTQTAPASENVPQRPFALWADLPEPGQFVVGLVYEESESYLSLIHI